MPESLDELKTKDKIIVACAKRNSGKSFLLAHIVKYYKPYFDQIFLICPTETVNQFWTKNNLVKNQFVFDTYHDEFIGRIIEKATKMKEKGITKRVLIILDDVCSDAKIHHAKNLKKVLTRGRHINISLLITAQYANHIPPVARNNADYFMVGQMNKEGIDTIFKDFSILSRDEFMDMYTEATKDYSFLVINNNTTANALKDEVYFQTKVPENIYNSLK